MVFKNNFLLIIALFGTISFSTWLQRSECCLASDMIAYLPKIEKGMIFEMKEREYSENGTRILNRRHK